MADIKTATEKSVEAIESAEKFIYKSTVEAYNQWAAIYDTDGNFLQALDSLMIPSMLSVITQQLSAKPKLVDLGCGTGRNTAALLNIPEARILGLDNSSAMLDIAKARCNQAWESSAQHTRAARLDFEIWDFHSLQEEHGVVPSAAQHSDAVVSTLVVEHIQLEIYFKACSMILRTGGVLLLTNMHSDMGNRGSQAGFTDPDTGEKIRPTSFVHTTEEVVQTAQKWGFGVIVGPEERAVHEDDLKKIGKRAARYVGCKVWFGLILKKL
ncbi:MAG: hypothetical protein Q9219_005653 [cf. Caloplaca sp. 3 TL-2023]